MFRVATLATALAIVPQGSSAPGIATTPERTYSAFSSDPAHAFDFLIGEWDVDLLVPRDDGTFEESAGGTASVHSILGGKAILKLSNTTPLPRFSVRYFDPLTKRWVQWLDRPEKNSSRLERLEGGFRHGRGELRRTTYDAAGKPVTTAQTFSDITPFSLRWDEFHSTDRGKSWTLDRVMEFTRTAVEPKYPVWLSDVRLAAENRRCDDGRFRGYELLVGKWRSEGARLDLAPILDGCAVMGILEIDGGGQELIFLTYDSFAESWVTAVLDDTPGTGLIVYSGSSGWPDLAAEDEGSLNWTVWCRSPVRLWEAGAQLAYQRGDRSVKLERVEDQRP